MGISNSKRMDWVDGVKGAGIVYTIYAHLLPMCPLKEIIYGFNLQMFFIIYGFCAIRRNDKEGLKKTLIRRLYSIGVPYILWALIFDAHSVKNVLKVLYGTNSSLVAAKSSGVLWFLPAFLVAVIIFEVIIYLCNNNYVKLFICGAASLLLAYLCFEFNIKKLPWGLDLAFLAITYMVVGHFVRKYFYKPGSTKTVFARIRNVILCCVGLASGALVVGLDTEKGCPQMANADYGNIFAFFGAGFGISLAMMYIIYSFYNVKGLEKAKSAMTKVGAQSLMIMIFHREFVVYYGAILKKIGIENSVLISLVASLMVAACSYLMSVFVTKYAPIFAGKK